MEVRGEVRRLADVFAEGEVEKASERLRSAADSHRQTLHTLETFLQENQKLIKLVQELPTKVSYPIMVPFGKAAFFPGKLVHTNEFLVLLGEGYYAECSAFKTLEILSRRENLLSSQITGVKSQLADLDVESRFFNETLAEAAAGVVEIREELVEPSPSTPSSSMSSLESGSDLSTMEREKLQKGIPATLPKIQEEHDVIMRKGEMVQSTDRDEEHERIMARLDEIEAAEAAAEMGLRVDGHATSTNVEIEHGGGKHVQETTNIEEIRGESAKVDGHERLGHGQRLKISTPGDLLKVVILRACNAYFVLNSS
ncbi:hypothetical protein KP509_06G085700 [Ceratopteris richardii]|uniref:Uncharacterized protein n=1 Tax=Ceratopteris richardii TaxID=49495 RepID=A0A8T2UKL2_CERRI|nr:hypothetical protein KP509_06G085700 [Ceratopteris richardii]